jgi:hypothetical protein
MKRLILDASNIDIKRINGTELTNFRVIKTDEYHGMITADVYKNGFAICTAFINAVTLKTKLRIFGGSQKMADGIVIAIQRGALKINDK